MFTKLNEARLALLNLSHSWKTNNDIFYRRSLQKLIFPQGIEFDGENYRTGAIPLTLQILNSIKEQNKAETKTSEFESYRTASKIIDFNELTEQNNTNIKNGGA